MPSGAQLGLSPVLRAAVQADLRADTNDVCLTETANPGLFKFVSQAVRLSLDLNEVPEAFLGSRAYHRCLSNERVQRDISSFDRIQSAFCSDEKLAYTTGDNDRRADTERAIRTGWIRECSRNPAFIPSEILTVRLGSPNN